MSAALAWLARGWRAPLVVTASATVWAALLVLLAVAGHAPSGPLVLPVPRSAYYAVEAVLVAPVQLLAAWIFAQVVARFGAGELRDGYALAAFALALPTLLLWVVPDLVAYLAFGFEGLGLVARIAPVASALVTLGLTTLLLRRRIDEDGTSWSWGRSFGVALVAYLAQAVVVLLTLR